MFGCSTRKAQWGLVCVSLVSAIAAITYAALFGARAWYAGVVWFGAAWMYWQTIRWMDAYDAW